jgi:hypothetical protein
MNFTLQLDTSAGTHEVIARDYRAAKIVFNSLRECEWAHGIRIYQEGSDVPIDSYSVTRLMTPAELDHLEKPE